MARKTTARKKATTRKKVSSKAQAEVLGVEGEDGVVVDVGVAEGADVGVESVPDSVSQSETAAVEVGVERAGEGAGGEGVVASVGEGKGDVGGGEGGDGGEGGELKRVRKRGGRRRGKKTAGDVGGDGVGDVGVGGGEGVSGVVDEGLASEEGSSGKSDGKGGESQGSRSLGVGGAREGVGSGGSVSSETRARGIVSGGAGGGGGGSRGSGTGGGGSGSSGSGSGGLGSGGGRQVVGSGGSGGSVMVGGGMGGGGGLPASAKVSTASAARVERELVVNYVPGDECRIALLENGRLEDYHAERFDSVSHVQNIYVGRVANVESGIQAAFIDFGLEQHGFLHVSDLHPKYFRGAGWGGGGGGGGVGGGETERVGFKTPRRDRPPIQECLRRGQEIAVQVIKEGVGTKGPTVTSYLSIPGRFLVMMPDMDKVGVSRKVEDDEARRKMREILDQLELPEGFGFILRTAGMDQTKTELKRDLAYLQRLWKDMERRKKTQKKPCLLYTESDLLVRTLRDQLTSDIKRIVVDDVHALERASRFLRIVSPRATVELAHYTGRLPVFHAMGVEEQVRTMTAREVPLASGGRLVIDETEALVAIDVNSGKTRGIHDAETNAYRTNMEAAEEICRQLRLRDLGGIVVNDLIDMRSLKHRRELEARFKELLKKDRAKSTVATIGPFGTLELTRQRMRGSHESVHFSDCPTCRGRGAVQKPDSVVSDAFRDMASLLQHERVVRVEMVVSPRIAGAILSGRRRQLNRLERVTNKRVDVRVSDALPIDRVTMYAYDDRGSDVDIAKIPKSGVRREDLRVVEFSTGVSDESNWAVDVESESAQALAAEAAATAAADEASAAEVAKEAEFDLDEMEGEGSGGRGVGGGVGVEGGEVGEGGKRRRRRRRRRKGDGVGGDGGVAGGREDGDGGDGGDGGSEGDDEVGGVGRRDGAGAAGEGGDGEGVGGGGEDGDGGGAGALKKKRRRRRRRGRGRGGVEGGGDERDGGGDGEGDGARGLGGDATGVGAGRGVAAGGRVDVGNGGGGGGDGGGGGGEVADADDGKPRKRRRTRRKASEDGSGGDGGGGSAGVGGSGGGASAGGRGGAAGGGGGGGGGRRGGGGGGSGASGSGASTGNAGRAGGGGGGGGSVNGSVGGGGGVSGSGGGASSGGSGGAVGGGAKVRTLYGAGRRRLSASERASAPRDE